MDNSNQILVLRDNARNELLKIQSAEDAISYLNKLKAIDKWVRAEKMDAELQNIIAEQKLRTQRILGELIADGQRKGIIESPGGDRKTNLPDRKVDTLDDIGISYKQSSNFQAIASIPEDDFEEFIQTKKENVKRAVSELTTTGAIALAKSLNNNKNKINEQFNRNPEYEQEVRELLEKINALPIFYRIKIKRGIKKGR